MSLGHKIAKSKQNWERKPADFYPTPIEPVKVLMDYLAPYGPLHVREPCCGEGNISRVMMEYGHEVTSSDLNYTGFGTGGVDYLRLPEGDNEEYEFDAVITNPPFSLAEQFIRRAMRDAPLIAMFLPNDYWHAKTRMKLFNSRPPKAILALTWRPVFLPQERGSSPLANYSWTVWDDDYVGPTQYSVVAKPNFRNLKPLEPNLSVLLSRLSKTVEQALIERTVGEHE